MKFGTGIIVLLALLSNALWGNQVNKTIHINGGMFTTVSSTQFSYLAYNSTSSFDPRNEQIHLTTDDTLIVKVFNNDSVTHNLSVKGMFVGDNILAGDSLVDTISFVNEGLYIYYDANQYPKYAYLGLSGMISVENSSHESFYWNIKDHRSTWNDSLVQSNNVNWNNYYPDYFTINGNSNPDINADPTARITGSVNDTILVFMCNTGQSVHSMHYHGYHLEVLYSSKFPGHVGRSKDTFGVYPMETMVLRLIPHQQGEYPVHDHNLVATTGGGMYPSGMFTTILITP